MDTSLSRNKYTNFQVIYVTEYQVACQVSEASRVLVSSSIDMSIEYSNTDE